MTACKIEKVKYMPKYTISGLNIAGNISFFLALHWVKWFIPWMFFLSPETWVGTPLVMLSPCPLAHWRAYRLWTSPPISLSSSPNSRTWPASSRWISLTTSFSPLSTRLLTILKTAKSSKHCKFITWLCPCFLDMNVMIGIFIWKLYMCWTYMYIPLLKYRTFTILVFIPEFVITFLSTLLMSIQYISEYSAKFILEIVPPTGSWMRTWPWAVTVTCMRPS